MFSLTVIHEGTIKIICGNLSKIKKEFVRILIPIGKSKSFCCVFFFAKNYM